MSDSVVLFVRKGAVRRYELLKKRTEGLSVSVAWDRRERPRRQATARPAAERRRSDRRQSASPIWDLADFCVAVPREGE